MLTKPELLRGEREMKSRLILIPIVVGILAEAAFAAQESKSAPRNAIRPKQIQRIVKDPRVFQWPKDDTRKFEPKIIHPLYTGQKIDIFHPVYRGERVDILLLNETRHPGTPPAAVSGDSLSILSNANVHKDSRIGTAEPNNVLQHSAEARTTAKVKTLSEPQ